MNDAERAALAALRFNWAAVPDDVWRPMRFHVDGLHPGVVQAVRGGLVEAAVSEDGSPIGLALQGQRGSARHTCSAGCATRYRRAGGTSSW